MTAMPIEVFEPEQLTVTSGVNPAVEIDLLAPAWMVLDLVKLSVPSVLVDNRVAPGVGGSNPLDPALNELRVGLPFWITGTVDIDGDPSVISGPAQFRRHWVYLCQHLFLPSTESALSAVYQSPDPDEDPIDLRIQFATPELGELLPTDWAGTLQVVLPDGPLVPSAAVV